MTWTFSGVIIRRSFSFLEFVVFFSAEISFPPLDWKCETLLAQLESEEYAEVTFP